MKPTTSRGRRAPALPRPALGIWMAAALAAACAPEPAPDPSGAGGPSALPAENQCAGLTDRHRVVETRHRAEVEGRTLTYTARAGFMPMRDHDSGRVLAHLAYMAYSLEDGAEPGVRPLTFLWNGGPGAPSSPLHLTGVGPRIVEMSDVPDGSRPAAPRMLDNDGTWLEFTDLVFVDPVGTGYSRATRPEHREVFWSDRGDVASVAEFIRLYLTRYDAWDAPLFVAGQSFGAARAAGMTEALPERGIPLAGAILISGGFSPGGPELRTALNLPSYTAAAFAHGRLPAELQEDLEAALARAEEWALATYAPALADLEALSGEERRELARELARFTGLDPAVLEANDLRVDTPLFAGHLLTEGERVVGRYDGRLTGPLPRAEGPYDPRLDPSLRSHFPPGLIQRYLAGELGFGCDRVYAGPFGGFWPPATSFRGDWMTVRWTRTPETATDPTHVTLERSLARDPDLRVYVAMGRYDLVTTYFAARAAVEGMDLAPEARGRITAASYPGGHSPYHDLETRMRLSGDVAAFMAAAIRSTGTTEP